MFPARAGMNRFTNRRLTQRLYVPRTCGDEPARPGRFKEIIMFPARAGMNRISVYESQSPHVWDVPRTCGDEPVRNNVYVAKMRDHSCIMFPARAGMNRTGRGAMERRPLKCSPHVRG